MEFPESTLEFTEDNIKKWKDKCSNEVKDLRDNPIKRCIQLVSSGALEKNPVKKIAIAHELSRFLTNPGGLNILILSLVDFDTSSQKKTSHNQRFLSVANIVAYIPEICMPYEEYCLKISIQLKHLLISENPLFSSLACIIFNAMLESPHANRKSISSVIIGPLVNALKDDRSSYEPEQSITAVSNLLNNHFPYKHFVPIFSELVHCWLALEPTPSALKSTIESCIAIILGSMDLGPACCLLEKAIVNDLNQVSRYSHSLSDHGITVIIDKSQDYVYEDLDRRVQELVKKILDRCAKELLTLELFFYFKDCICSSSESNFRILSANIVKYILEESMNDNPKPHLNIIAIVATNVQKSLRLLSRTFSNQVNLMRTSGQDFLATMEVLDESISSTIDILEMISIHMSNEGDIDFVKRKLLPSMREYKDLRSDLRKKCGLSHDNLCLRVNELLTRLDANIPTTDYDQDEQSEHEYRTILMDLNDTSVPVRVHGLIRLKEMVVSNDRFVLDRVEQVLSKVESSLADQESYVYLACINLISEFAIRRTPIVLPYLMRLCTNIDLGVTVRINIGEVLVKLVKQLNETTPHFAGRVMNLLLKQSMSSGDELVRISSLVSMGEVCSKLGDSMSKYIIDIMFCLDQILENDTIDVKCAAIDLLRTALSGQDSLKIESIQTELTRIYSLLKKVGSRSIDDKLSLHIHLCLDEIDRVARQLLALDVECKPNIVKKIYVKEALR